MYFYNYDITHTYIFKLRIKNKDFKNKLLSIFEKVMELLFLASYYKQLSADIKMYNYKIKTNFSANKIMFEIVDT